MMESVFVLIAALAPVCLLLLYIYRKDKFQQEPVKELMKAFAAGGLSVFLSLLISIPTVGVGVDEIYSIPDALKMAFLGAAIPEELAKFLMLWFVVRRNRYFDEHMDGIVYAVYVSLGFAAIENIMYLFENYDSWVSVGISRALFAIPGHFAFGVLMGYYFSLVRFSPVPSLKNKILVLAAPMLVHGLYDSILLVIDVTPVASIILMILFLFLCHRMWKYGNKKIVEHLERDRMTFNEE